MKRPTHQNRQKKKILELAREYKSRGYRVLSEIRSYDPPQPINGIIPDIVAKRGDETIIIEVKTRESIKDSKDTISQLADYAKKVPGTRFDLVITNPKPQSSTQVKLRALQQELEVLKEGLLQDMDEAIQQRKYDMVVIFATRLLAGLLTQAAVKKEIFIPFGEIELGFLSNRLANEGIISQSVFNFCHRVQEIRNSLVHGIEAISAKEAGIIRDKVVSLLREW